MMADEIRELMNKKDEIEKEIKEYHDVLQLVGLTIMTFRGYIEYSLVPHYRSLLADNIQWHISWIHNELNSVWCRENAIAIAHSVEKFLVSN